MSCILPLQVSFVHNIRRRHGLGVFWSCGVQVYADRSWLNAVFPLMLVLISRRVQQTSAQGFEASDLLESVLNEVFMPCVENVSNITSYGQPMPAVTENATQSDASVNVNKTFINESVLDQLLCQ